VGQRLQSWPVRIDRIQLKAHSSFWESQGPQHTLYVPAPVLISGLNEVVLLELETPAPSMAARTQATPDFHSGHPCDPQGHLSSGSPVAMFGQNSAYGASQNWIWTPPGQIALKSNSSLCIAAGPSKDPSTGQPALQLLPCSDTHALSFSSQSSDIRGAGMCVDITSHGTTDGSALELYACNGGLNQQFDFAVSPCLFGAHFKDGTFASKQQSPAFLITACEAREGTEKRILAEMFTHEMH
jgi:hypothetical protein